MKQNKKNVAVFLAVFVLFVSLSLPSFAYTDTSSNGVDFSDQPIPALSSYDASSVMSHGIQVASAKSGASYLYTDVYYASVPTQQGKLNEDVYTFYNNANGRIYCASNSKFSVVRVRFYPNNGNTTDTNTVSSTLNSTYNLYYTSWYCADYSDVLPTIPCFSSEDDGLTAVQDWINNPPVSVTPHSLNYSIPAGYVAYFEIPSNETIRASVTTTSGVPLTPAQWASTNVLYGYSSSLPSGAFTLPITGSTSFSWNTGKTNLFGKSQHWSWLGTINTSSKYYFISNPTYSNVVGTNSNGSSMIVDNPSATNGYVDVYLSSVIDVKLFPLKSTITYDPSIGAYGGIDDGASGESYSVGYDDTTGQWVTTDPTGNPVGVGGVPIGGDNSIDSIPTSDTIVDWLENIARTIGAFFRGAVGAVTTLVSAGSDFIHALVGLYSWLPGSVYAVLSSALILVIVIGVIKVFV